MAPRPDEQGERTLSAVDTVEPAQQQADDTPSDTFRDLAHRWLPPAVAALAVLAALGGYLVAAHELWFFGDDWDFLLRRPLRHDTLDSLFRPHNEHWSTIPILIYRALYAAVGMHHYLPYVLPMLAAHAGVCLLLWVLMRRAGATPWSAAAGIVLMAICGAGAENLIWDFQVGFVGAVFFGLLAIFLADHEALGRRRLALVWLAACCSLMCSGIGVPMLAGLGMFVFLRSGRRVALAVVSVPAVVYAVWYVAYGAAGAAPDSTTVGVRLHSAKYLWRGLTNVWQANTGIPNSGALILALLVVPVLLDGSRDRLGRLAISLVVAAVALFAFTAWTRVRLGLSQGTASRYVYIATALTIPALVWAIDRFARWVRARTGSSLGPYSIAVALVVLLTALNMVDSAHAYLTGRRALVRASESRILGAADLVREHAVAVNPYPDLLYSGRAVTAAILAEPAVQNALPKVHLSSAALLEARGRIQVVVQPGPVRVPAATAARIAGKPVEPASSTTCTTQSVGAGTQVELTPAGSGGRAVVTAPGKRLVTYLLSGGAHSPMLTWPISNESPVYVATSYGGGQLVIQVPTAGKLTVCLQ